MVRSATGYRGNTLIKRTGVEIDWTPEMFEEYMKCSEDVFYFIEHYFKIVTEEGFELMELRDYQVDMIKSMLNNRFTIALQARQSGKTEAFRAFLIWYILFHDYKTVAIVANKGDVAREILGKLETSYQGLPTWLQHGVTDFNKGSFVLENNSRIIAVATAKDALRSYTCHIIVIDEAAHIDNWDEFYTAIKPTISAGKATKLIMASTPNGLNHFFKFWEGCDIGNPKVKKNAFHGIFVPWFRVPGRDEAWKEQELLDPSMTPEKFAQEHEVEFLGSSGTLISGWRLKQLKHESKEPIQLGYDGNLKMYKQPLKKRFEHEVLYQDGLFVHDKMVPKEPNNYMIIVDVSRGKGLDYSAFSVIDVTTLPYEQVCTFRDNLIAPSDYAHIIYGIAKHYNDAGVLTEINDMGEAIGNILLEEYAYENVYCTKNMGRNGKEICFSKGKGIDIGIRTTTPVKNNGCMILKLLVEQAKLIINDRETIEELNVFSRDKNTYKAESGKHDDLVMGLVLFGWLTDQKFFKELTDINTMALLREQTTKEIEDNFLSFGIIDSDPPIANRWNEPYNPYHLEHNMNLPFNPFNIGGEGPDNTLWQNAVNF